VYYAEDIAGVVARYPREVETLKRNIAVAIQDGFPPQPRVHRTDGPHAGSPRFREALGIQRQYVDRNLVACALGHLLLKDPRAAEQVRTAFLDIIDWNPDLLGPYSVHGPWGDELGLSLARCLFAVYDWTFDLYDEKQHGYIRGTLAQYARQVATTLRERNFFNSPGDSHAGRMPAYLGQAALVLKGYVPDEEAAAWLQAALDVYGSFFPHYGGRDGGWAEGTFYSTSYSKWYLPFFFALERHTGFSFLDRPFYRNYAQFLVHFCQPGWDVHPFCDGYWCHPEDAEWPGFFAQDPYGVYAERFGPAIARRYAAMQVRPEIFKLHLLDVFRVARPEKEARAVTESANCRWFRDAGFVSMHAELGKPEEDTAVLVRASRYGAISHQHADQGNFAIISRGKGLITPSGYFGHSYGTKHHFDWTNQTQAHNCVLVDGKGQKSRDFRTTGRIESVSDEGWMADCVMDLGTAYPQLERYRRRVVLLRPDVVIVVDDLRCASDVEYSWLAHSPGEPQVDGQGVLIRREPASIRLQVFSGVTEDLALSWSDQYGVALNEGVPREHWSTQPIQYHMTWRAKKARNRRFLALMILNGSACTHAWRGENLSIRYAGRELEFPMDPERDFVVTIGK